MAAGRRIVKSWEQRFIEKHPAEWAAIQAGYQVIFEAMRDPVMEKIIGLVRARLVGPYAIRPAWDWVPPSRAVARVVGDLVNRKGTR